MGSKGAGIGAAILGGVSVGMQVFQAVEGNQQKQHAKGALEAQQHEFDSNIKKLDADEDKAGKYKKLISKGTQSAAMRAVQASMSASSGFGGTLLTGPQGAPSAPTQPKSLLGV